MSGTHEKFQLVGVFNYQAFQNHDFESDTEWFASEKAAKEAVRERWDTRRGSEQPVRFDPDSMAFISGDRERVDYVSMVDREYVFMDLYKMESVGFEDGVEKFYVYPEPYGLLTVGPRGRVMKENA